jgi:hypothetical protein
MERNPPQAVSKEEKQLEFKKSQTYFSDGKNEPKENESPDA